MDLKEYSRQLDELEGKLDRLRALYEQYFQGLERLEPTIPRKDVERRVQALRRIQVRNTALRFRFQQLLQKFTTYLTYWGRVARQIEEGTFRRDLLKARKARDSARKRRAEAREGFEAYDVGTEDFEVLPPDSPSWDDVSEVTKTNPYRPGKGEKAPAASNIGNLPRPPLVPLIDRRLSDGEIDAVLAGLRPRSSRPNADRPASPARAAAPGVRSSKAGPPKPPPTSARATNPRLGATGATGATDATDASRRSAGTTKASAATGRVPPKPPMTSPKAPPPPRPSPPSASVSASQNRPSGGKKPSRAAMPVVPNPASTLEPRTVASSRAANPFKAKPRAPALPRSASTNPAPRKPTSD